MPCKKMKVRVIVFFILSVVSILSEAKQSPRYIELVVGAMRTEYLGEIIRVAVARNEVISATTLDNGELLIIPQAAGRTELTVWTKGERRHSFHVNVVSKNMSRELGRLRSIFRDFSEVKFRSEGETILAEGRLRSDDFVIFDDKIEDYGNVVSLVRPKLVDIEDMIDIEVRVLEITSGFTRELGIQWNASMDGPSIGYIQNFRTNPYFVLHREGNQLAEDVFGDDDSPLGLSTASQFFAGIATSLTSKINLLQEDGDAKILAEPFLSTQSGESANFQSGGSYPIPYTSPTGDAGVVMQDYGIILDIEPVSDSEGNIRTRISAEFSSIDFSVVVDGIPGIQSRNTESVVNIKSGETIVISGLLKTEDSQNYTKVPFLGDIPIIGELFKSTNFNQGRTELVILATPRIRGSNDERYHEGVRNFEDSLREVRSKGDMTQHLVY